MPDYNVTSPDGQKFKITAPDGASQDEILAYAQKQFAPKKPLTETNPSEYDPDSQAFQAKYGPLSQSNFENFRAAWGKAVTDLGRGAKQLGQAIAPKWAGGGTGYIASQVQQDEVKRRDAALLNTKSGFAGNIAGNVATALPTMFIPGVNTYSGAAVLGAGLGAAQPVGTQDSRGTNAALGAAGGVAGKYVGGKIGDWASQVRDSLRASQSAASASSGGAGSAAGVSGEVNATLRNAGGSVGTVGDDASAAISNSQRNLIERGKALGLRVTPGQASGSRALQQMEAKLESQPMTSGPFNQIKSDNAKGITRAFLKAIGEEGDEASSDVLQRADTRIGEVFENAAQKHSIVYDDVLQSSLADIEGKASSELGKSEFAVLKKQLENVVDKAATGNGKFDGAQYQAMRESLGRLSGNSSSGIGHWARQIRNSLDDALERSAGDGAGKALREARSQYRILATAMGRVGAINPSGNVQPGLMANALSNSDKRGYLLGKNQSDLYNALRFAQAFKPLVGDSGTATRSPVQGITELALRIPYNVAARAYTSPLSVNAASLVGPASRSVGDALRSGAGTAPYYAPYLLPGQGGLLGSQLGQD